MSDNVQTLALTTPLEEAIDQLSQQLAGLAAPAQPSLYQLSYPLPALPALSWLQAQHEFPKLYWQSRNRQQEAALSGAIDTWWLTEKQSSKQHWPRFSQAPDLEWRYYGGHGFTLGDPLVTELGGNRMYLPKVEYRREAGQHWLLFYLALQPEQWRAQLDKAQYDLNQLAEPKGFFPQDLQITQQQHVPDYARWTELVAQLTTQEQLQHTPKVVLCRETILTTSQPANSWQLLRDWQDQQPNCYQFGIQTDPQQAFFGCSPERLFLRSQDHLFTEALAGTCSKGDTPEQSARFAEHLLQDRKNIHENELVADDIQQQLRPLTQTIQLESNAHLVELSQLNHLCRDIEAQLKPHVSEHDLLGALHPTAAIGGLPRTLAQQFLAHHEDVDRGWYAGAFGMIGQQHSEFCVTIRSIQQCQNKLSLFTGAGIVAGSEPCTEWHELNSKLASAMAVIQASQSE